MASRPAVRVPGGSISYERHSPLAIHLLKLLGAIVMHSSYAAMAISQDIVVRDDSGRELFREGPYDRITLPRATDRLLDEIQRDSLSAFIRDKQRSAGQLGAVDSPSGNMTMWGFTTASLRSIRGYLRRFWP
jgi:hypothetical protein